jgi:hypothetical protein
MKTALFWAITQRGLIAQRSAVFKEVKYLVNCDYRFTDPVNYVLLNKTLTLILLTWRIW